ncbi:hypothetical protein ACFQVC_20150 [Streptomyces monticola]|uniref:Histidine phosphatase family protein n=1 Tax=Streptomyces monticola TaxID=2666263 RepID=A0ABW2JM44_9ACTN
MRLVPKPVGDLTVMVIRHGEKPDAEHPGVDERLNPDKKSLTARGWDRARKLPGLFAPADDGGGGSDGENGSDGEGTDDRTLPLPAAVYAAGRGPAGGARRLAQTVTPLAEQLGLPVRTDCGKTQERALAEAVLAGAASPVLICWQHSHIPSLVRALGARDAGPAAPPRRWPSDRFDLVWLFRYDAGTGRWTFRQADQGLLEGDR